MIDFSNFELMQFPEQLQTELDAQSDRGLAVLGSAGLEFLLEELLRAHLVDDKTRESTFQENGPLSTFSSRISMCFLLGLISRDEHAELHIIRKVRNSLTHEIRHASFSSSQKNRDLCANLRIGERLYAPPAIPFAELPSGVRGIPANPEDYPLLSAEALELPNKDEPRARFAASIRALMRVLVGRTVLVSRVTTPPEFTSPEQPASIGFERMTSSFAQLEKSLETLIQKRDELLRAGRELPPELVDIPGTSPEDVASNRQLEMFMRLGNYANEVIRRSKLAAETSA